jgi:putative Holliday junction resolvase
LGRTLAVDLGTRRVGLALSDPLRMIASPLGTVPFRSMTSLTDRLTELCRERDVELVVVGLPVKEDGSEGEGCVRARVLAEMVGERGIRSELWDESWSSRDAEALLRSMGKTRKSAVGRIDAIAASLILKDYLDSHARGD